MISVLTQIARKWAAARHECRAQGALARGRTEEASAHARAFLALAPDSPQANFLLARLCVEAGRHAEALEHLERVARHWLDDPPTQYAIGVCHDYLDQTDAAIAAYRRTLALAPHWVVALKHLGRCCWRRGDARGAREALVLYCSEAPDDKEAHDLLGYLSYQQGHLRAAYGHYAQAARLDPLNPSLDRNARLLYRRSATS